MVSHNNLALIDKNELQFKWSIIADDTMVPKHKTAFGKSSKSFKNSQDAAITDNKERNSWIIQQIHWDNINS